MLYVIGTEIFQFGPLGAEKFAFKIFTWHFWHNEIMANCNAILSTTFEHLYVIPGAAAAH